MTLDSGKELANCRSVGMVWCLPLEQALSSPRGAQPSLSSVRWVGCVCRQRRHLFGSATFLLSVPTKEEWWKFLQDWTEGVQGHKSGVTQGVGHNGSFDLSSCSLQRFVLASTVLGNKFQEAVMQRWFFLLQTEKPQSPWHSWNPMDAAGEPLCLQAWWAVPPKSCRPRFFTSTPLNVPSFLFPVVSEHSEQRRLHARNLEKSYIPEFWTFAQISYKFSQGNWATTRSVVSTILGERSASPPPPSSLFLCFSFYFYVVPYKQ